MTIHANPATVQTPRPARTVAVLAAAATIGAVMQTVIVPLLADLPTILETSPDTASWAVSITLLVTAVTTPLAGRLGDLYGKKRLALICLLPMIAGCLVCALATDAWLMIAGRALQGIGSGIMPLGLGLLHDVLPKWKRPGAVALLGATAGLGGALGLPLAAACDQLFSWRFTFVAVAVLAAVVAWLLHRWVPEGRTHPSEGQFDWSGAAALSVGLVALLGAVTEGNRWGWTSVPTLAVLALSTVSFAVWVRVELRNASPLVDLRLLATPTVAMVNVVALLIGFVMYAPSLVYPQVMQLPEATGFGLGQSMLAMGLWIAPNGLAMMAASPFGGRLTARRGPKPTLVLGCSIALAALAVSPLCLGQLWQIAAVGIVSNIGFALIYGALPTIVMDTVPAAQIASANSVNNLIRSLGMAVSAAVAGAILATMRMPFADTTAPSLEGFQATLAATAAVCVAALIIAAIVKHPPTRRNPEAVPDLEPVLAGSPRKP
ncbi:MAG: MFS transporter [Bifidobacteriaceae bacterium]|jgi:MFS family permease|nr:MFS transporter [Bifidobacteriaceae bacterium]